MDAREFLRASVLAILFLVLYLNKPIFGWRIAQVGPVRIDSELGLTNIPEPVYQSYPPYFYARGELRAGRLPLWIPHTGGGSPFVGNQQNGVFSPFHLPFHLIPERLFQYFWLWIFAGCFYFAWMATYLLGRWYGLSPAVSAFAAGCYAVSQPVSHFNLELPSQNSIYTPALVLGAEALLHGRLGARRWLPWLIALPALVGHGHVTMFSLITAGVQLLAGAWGFKRLAAVPVLLWFSALSIIGIALGSVPLLTSLEYIGHSYTKVWRSLPEFSWASYRISRPLAAADAGLLIGALASGALFVWSIKSLRPQAPWTASRRVLGSVLSVLALAVAVACLMNAGMLNPLLLLPRYSFAHLFDSPTANLIGCVVFGFSLAAWAAPPMPLGLKILAGFTLVGAALYIKMPGLINSLYELPAFKYIYLYNYNTGMHLGLSMLAGWGLHGVALLSQEPRPKRLASVFSACALTVAVVAGCLLAEPLQDPVARFLGQAVNSELKAQSQVPAGGITDAGKVSRLGKKHTVRGWVPSSLGAESVAVGLQQGQSQPQLSQARTWVTGDRIYFEKALELPPGTSIPVALIADRQGGTRVIRGSEISRVERPSWSSVGASAAAALWPWPALALGAPAALVLGVGQALIAGCVWSWGSHAVFTIEERDNLTQEWPAIKTIKRQEGDFRIYSFDQYLFPAALSTIHGVSDLRAGTDNIDVVGSIHFLNMAQALAQAERQANQDWAGSWLGLGNVKYLLSRPKDKMSQPWLSPVQQGPDMNVYENKNFGSKLRFFGDWKYLDGSGLDDWRQARQLLGAIYQSIVSGTLDPRKDLLLHDRPPQGWPQSGEGARATMSVRSSEPSRVVVSVDASSPGFLFFSSNHFPGWKARIDGQRVRALRSWVTFWSVPISAGRHTVEFLYRPLVAYAALALTGLALIAWMALCLLTRSAVPEPLPVKPNKKKAQAEPWKPACDGFRYLEWILSVLVGANLLFWGGWALLKFQGPQWVRITAGMILLAGAAMAAWSGALARSPEPTEP